MQKWNDDSERLTCRKLYRLKKRIENKSIRLCKVVMMIKNYNHNKDKYKWLILMITQMKTKQT